MLRSSSKSSLAKKSLNDKYFTDHNKLLLLKIDATLEQAANTLPHAQYSEIFISIAINLIRKFQSENIDHTNVELLKRLLNKYNSNLELSVRIMLLQVKVQGINFHQENLALLNKAKHMIIDTDFQYLLSKVFILEAKIYHSLQQKDLEIKSLTKAIDFAQNFVLEYLNNRQDIRKQIAQSIVVAYFQLYKLKKEQNHKQAEEYLKRAYRTTQKNFGQESDVTELMTLIMNDHKNIGKGLQKMMSQSVKSSQQQKASTQIMTSEIKKDVTVQGMYLWEDQKITVQMIKSKNQEDVVISYAEYQIKLDMSKIKMLQNAQWVKISHGEVSIIEDQILKALGVKQENTLTTRIGIKNISRQEIIKKDSLSSSSQDPSFIEKEDFNFIRRLGRAQSAKKPPNNI